MNDAWLKDIMTQKFLNSDITRLIMLKGMIRTGTILSVYKKTEIMEYIYRVYSDYDDVRAINPDARVRNIKRYGIADIKYLLDDAIREWQEYAINNVLVQDERYIYLKDVSTHGQELAKFTEQLINMLQKKYFSIVLHEPLQLDFEECRDDCNLDLFGKSLFRNRVFEDMQYCPLCEEVDTSSLRVVHILPAKYCKESRELIDKNNALIMCCDHAKDYIEGKFVFNTNGFVSNICSDIVNEKMHLAIQVKNRKRRSYIDRYNVILGRNKDETI